MINSVSLITRYGQAFEWADFPETKFTTISLNYVYIPKGNLGALTYYLLAHGEVLDI